MATSDRLSAYVKNQGVKQVALANKLKESENWVSRRVRGEVPILADELVRIADALGVDPCIFLREENQQGAPYSGSLGRRPLTGDERGQRILRDILRDELGIEEADLRQALDTITKVVDALD